jgi:hypothetical protein
MAPRAVGAIGTWKIILVGPDGKRKRAQLSQIGSFSRNETIQIGRDPNWADLVLPANTCASGKHCVLSVKDSYLASAANYWKADWPLLPNWSLWIMYAISIPSSAAAAELKNLKPFIYRVNSLINLWIH